MRIPRRPLWPLITLILFALAGCGKDERTASPLDTTTVEQLSRSEVDALELTLIDSVTLGTAGESVEEITDLRIKDGKFYVLDAMAKHVRVFGRDGRLHSTIGRAGKGPGEFQDAMSLAVVPEGLFVADPMRGKELSLFTEQGRFVENRAFHTPTPPTSLASSGELIATMGLLSIKDPATEGWNVVGISTMRGDSLGTGCVLDSRFIESRKRDGRLSHFGFGTVTTRADTVYCTQGISPVVQVMDRTGRAVRQIRVAPPFYVAPTDGELKLNQKAMFDFLGTFTAMGGFTPVEGGFVSMYTRFNQEAGEIRVHLLVCRNGAPLRCGTVENIRKPVYIPTLDTVYIEEEPQADRPARIGIYRIAKREA
ncbi:MAG TPA: 6-bladed beta-propeller [Longimicrobium sp.]|nr:6-bladed beta-propeller [Longimicrobium sp.]